MRGRLMVVVAVALASATSLQAQAPADLSHAAPAATAQVDASPVATPAPAPADQATGTFRLGPSAVGAELLAPAVTRATGEQRTLVHSPQLRRQPGLALMIVGGALFLGGAIIDGDAGTALMVGGVVVGAVGLYEYLQ